MTLFRGAWSALVWPFRSSSTYSSSSSSSLESQYPTPNHFDVVIVGGGIVGIATARELVIRRPYLRLALVEKESKLAAHQSGHNSGVIHAGIYYTPNTLKARLCVQGFQLLYSYLKEKSIPHRRCGKLIVAVEEKELPALQNLYERGQQNGVQDLRMVSGDEISKIEPHAVGLKAIWSPHTGIVDYQQVTKSFGDDFEKKGGKILLNYKVHKFELDQDQTSNYPIKIKANGHEKKKNVLSDDKSIKEDQQLSISKQLSQSNLTESDKESLPTLHARYVITAGGLYSDKLAAMTGCEKTPQIVPFRGEYLLLKNHRRDLIRGNIYPVPDPRLPFLGVHFTPRMDGHVLLGPNAVFAFKREGYTKTSFDFKEACEALFFKGFQKLAFKYFIPGLEEYYRSFFMRAQVKQLQRYIPELTLEDVERGPSGVRAQALSSNGELVEDFVFDTGSSEFAGRVLHVRNCPSPAATASMAIAKMIIDKLETDYLDKNKE